MGYVLIYRDVPAPVQETSQPSVQPMDDWEDPFTPEEYAEMEREAEERDRFLDEVDGFYGPEDDEDDGTDYEDEDYEDEDYEEDEDPDGAEA